MPELVGTEVISRGTFHTAQIVESNPTVHCDHSLLGNSLAPC